MRNANDINLSGYLIPKHIGQESNADKELEVVVNKLKDDDRIKLTQEQIETIALKAYRDYINLANSGNMKLAIAFSKVRLNTLIEIYSTR